MVLAVVLPELKRNLNLASALRCLPFQWDEKTGKIQQNKSQSLKLFLNLGTTLHGAYVLFQISSLFRKKPRKCGSSSKRQVHGWIRYCHLCQCFRHRFRISA